ncbi:hypothetical protein [Pararobbsia silviterrae]|uniref:Uncharacterized protein n=1 Tax=Pararobbsia silviterrae TaxID=1792498 RepID=A0A494X301_9BURK|nr:hypothetical protein [Pararobbsia silviterrae]RKP44730.1 hypothetical protein D7S86_27295 [Pararobbsia silviterrae]
MMNLNSQLEPEQMDEVLDTILKRVPLEQFRMADIVDSAERYGFARHDGTANRIVDRLIFRERRSGRLQMVAGLWIRQH